MILERDIGLEISRATLDGWALKVGELLIPMVAAMRRELISGTYIQADETPVFTDDSGAIHLDASRNAACGHCGGYSLIGSCHAAVRDP